MSRADTTRRFATWAALLAVLAATLLPAMAHAFGLAGQATKWVEVCSASGLVTIAVPANGPGFPRAPKAADLEHCPFCSTPAATVAILPPTVTLLVPPALSGPVPLLFLHAPRPPFALLAAQPRAPPFAS